MSKDIQPLTIRFPLKLHNQIKSLADKNHRSFNLQVVHMLHEFIKYRSGALDKQEEADDGR